MDVLVLQGANLSRMGRRLPHKYGTTTTQELDQIVIEHARSVGLSVEIFYTELEGEAIKRIDQAAREGVRGLIMNPGGFVYSGYALRDCLRDQKFPYIEIHLSNSAGKGVGSKSIPGEASRAYACGFGPDTYRVALEGMAMLLNGIPLQ
ncbi:type II 3-dehydroquinate dehydratase [Hydrogenophaga sp. OTU3427]|uniref:type II 3-dehydroquinate dehydratase n=1 Tax=Hydrogenophaga sp. OTU3427 TaxID=3043856 RepID=UPI00313A7C21